MQALPKILAAAVLATAPLASKAMAQASSVATSTPPVAAPRRFVSEHRLVIGGEKIAFTATAGETLINDDNGEPIGAIFSYAYVKHAAPGERRPVTFVFGGGPGSASHALQVGGLGPWSIAPERMMIRDGKSPSSLPPYDLVENQNSLLNVSDLVFVDPVGTGYSRFVGKGKPSDFWGIDQDAETLAQFVQAWITENRRWSSPKFYIGESYGGSRAAPLARALTAGPGYLGYWRGVTFNGMAILVNHLGFPMGGAGFSAEEITAMTFPSFAATAWNHGAIDRRERTVQSVYDAARAFAERDYLPALKAETAKTLDPKTRKAVVEQLVAFTGLPAATFDQKLSLSSEEFAKSVLASRGLTVGTYDSRYTLSQAISGGDPVADDPALFRSFNVLGGAMAEVEAQKLGVRMDRQFVSVRWRDLLTQWDFTRKAPAFPAYPAFKGTQAEELAVVQNRNQDMKLLFASGRYDLVLPAAMTDYVVAHTPFDRARTEVRTYETGHELYLGASVAPLAQDLRTFIRSASRP